MPDSLDLISAALEANEAVSLDKLTVDELRELAGRMDVELGGDDRKADIVAKIEQFAGGDASGEPKSAVEVKPGDTVRFVTFGGGTPDAEVLAIDDDRRAHLRVAWHGKTFDVTSSPHDPTGVKSDSWHMPGEDGPASVVAGHPAARLATD
jgi:plastocyanin